MALAAVLAALGLAWWRVERLLTAAMQRRHEWRVQQMAVLQARLAMEQARNSIAPEPEDMPLDLASRVQSESEDWAREQMQSLIRQLYMQHQNWDTVRAMMSKMEAAALQADIGWSQTTRWLS